jgi:DNA-binding transcriptional LysR family regulator
MAAPVDGSVAVAVALLDCSIGRPFLARNLVGLLHSSGGGAAAARLRKRAAKVHNWDMFDWNDLKHFLAVARHGSTLAAARALGVSQSTVQRRVVELERRIGRRLVKRHATGYRLTELGEQLRPHAERIEDAIAALERQLAASGTDLAGTIKLTCPEPLVYRIARSRLLDLFYARYPQLNIEFVMSDRYLDLSKGEADIAIRAGDMVDEALVGRKISDSPWAVYASRSYVERHGKPEAIEDLNRHSAIGFDGALSEHRAARWLSKVAPHAKIVARNNSIPGLVYAVRSGLGVAPLPMALVDSDIQLLRVLGPIPELATGWYLLTHPDLRYTPRVRALFDFIIERLDIVRPILIEPASPQEP